MTTTLLIKYVAIMFSLAYFEFSLQTTNYCGLAINGRLNEEKLPSLSYRISADHGEVQFARSASSQSDYLFGSTVNVCAKINSIASPNGMVIGNNLYQITLYQI
jgi:class 3 adenylate cyclase